MLVFVVVHFFICFDFVVSLWFVYNCKSVCLVHVFQCSKNGGCVLVCCPLGPAARGFHYDDAG